MLPWRLMSLPPAIWQKDAPPYAAACWAFDNSDAGGKIADGAGRVLRLEIMHKAFDRSKEAGLRDLNGPCVLCIE